MAFEHTWAFSGDSTLDQWRSNSLRSIEDIPQNVLACVGKRRDDGKDLNDGELHRYRQMHNVFVLVGMELAVFEVD